MQARKSFLIFLTNGVGAALGLVTLFFIARYTPPAMLGLYGFAYSILRIGAQLSNLGFDSAHIKRVSEGQDLGDCIVTFAGIKVALTVAMTVLVLVAAFTWEHYKGFFDSTSLRIIVLVAAYFFVLQLNSIIVHTFNALRFTAKTQVLALAENIAKTPVLIMVALIFGSFSMGQWIPFGQFVSGFIDFFHIDGPWTIEFGATAISVGHLVGIVVSTAVGVGLFVYHRYPVGRFDKELFRSYVRFAVPIAAITVVGVLLRRVDTIMLGYFWSASDVGWYFAGERIITMILIVPNAIAVLFFPMISQMAARGDQDGVNDLSLRTQRMISLIVFPMAMLGIVYAAEGIHIFLADRWLPGTGALQWLIVFVVLQSFVLVSRNIIMGFDRPGLTTKISFIMIGVNFVLNLVLIPNSILGVPLLGLRATGAAMATAIAQAVGFVMLLFAARAITGRSTIGRGVVTHVTAAVAIGLGLWLTKDLAIFGGLDRWYELLFAGVLGGLLYLASLVAVGELTRKDLDLVLDTFHPGRMARYIKDEVTGRDKK